MDDLELLREYAQGHSEKAFATLVARHIDLVYSVTLRQVGNPHDAQEITQAVFVILARKSATLGKGTILPGWLHRTARLAALQSLRTENRRLRREQEAYMQSLSDQTEPDIWSQLSPLLEDAMDGLREKERSAIVLRFMEGKGLREVGLALGRNEDATQKLVSRAVEKMRIFFAKRGIKVSAGVLLGVLSANSLQAAPAGLAASVTATVTLKGAAATPSSVTIIKGTLKLMAMTKLKAAALVAAGLVIAGGTTTILVKDVYLSEPRYQGKSLSAWLEPTYRITKKQTPQGVSESITKVYDDKIDNAIRHMGKQAIPALLKMARSNSANADEVQNRAAAGFVALGPLAEEAIPELACLVTNRSYAEGAAQSLAGISPNALPPLLNALTNQDNLVRSRAANAVGFVGFNSRWGKKPPLGSDASAAIEALIRLTRDEDEWVRNSALESLGFIAQEPERVVPVLIEKLRDPSPWSRVGAAHSLGRFKTKARPAIPALTEAIDDSDENVRRAAKDALKEITAGTKR